MKINMNIKEKKKDNFIKFMKKTIKIINIIMKQNKRINLIQ